MTLDRRAGGALIAGALRREQGGKMKVRITRNVIVKGETYKAGDEVEVEKAEAQLLIGMRKAEPVKAAAERATAAGQEDKPSRKR